MKANQRDFLAKARAAAGQCRLWFACGADEAGAAAALARVAASLPDPGERVDLSGSQLRADPVLLVDEARSTSLFGDSRHLWLRVAGDEAHDALALLCELADRGEAGGAWPVFVLATAATDKSRSARLLLDRKDALVGVFHPPDLKDIASDIRAMGDVAGLKLGGDIAERIARAAGLDVRLAQSEVDKLALYLDSTPQAPRNVTREVLEAVGAKTEEDGFMPLVNAVLAGETRRLPAELARLRELGLNPVGVALALERRVGQLAVLAAKLRPGDDIARLLETERVFFRDRRDVQEQLRCWHGGKLERLVPRLTRLHRDLLGNSQLAELVLAHSMVQIARFAAARR